MFITITTSKVTQNNFRRLNRVSRHLKGQRTKNQNIGHSKLAFLLFDARHRSWSETLITPSSNLLPSRLLEFILA
jgi:hypothetical protein